MVAKIVCIGINERLLLVSILDVMRAPAESLGDLVRQIEQPEADGKEHQLDKELAEEVIGGE